MFHATPEVFPCLRCGACCQHVDDVEEISSYATKAGVCRYYDTDERQCQIYDNRPTVCDIWKTYKTNFEAQDITWDDFVYTNMMNCATLRFLNGIPEPEDSLFLNIQDEIAALLIQDLSRPRPEQESSEAVDKTEQINSSTISKKQENKTPLFDQPVDLNIPDLGIDAKKSSLLKPNKHRGELL